MSGQIVIMQKNPVISFYQWNIGAMAGRHIVVVVEGRMFGV